MSRPAVLQETLREALWEKPEGTSVVELVRRFNVSNQIIQKLLRRTFGCYVVRYDNSPETGQQISVWACVPAPVNAERPPSLWKDRENRLKYMKHYHAVRKDPDAPKKPRKPKAPVGFKPTATKPVATNQPGYRPKTVWVKT